MKIKGSTKKILTLSLLVFAVVMTTGCSVPQNSDGTVKLIEVTTTFKETMDSENWFNALLVWPMAQALNKMIPSTGVIGALILLTVIVNAILFIFTVKSQIATQQMQLLQPELQRLQRKYEGRTDDASRMKQANEMNALYKKYNVNPFSTIIATFIQFPIIIAMYQAVQRSYLLKNTTVLGLNLNTTPLNGIKGGQWLYLVIFAIMGVCQYFSTSLPQILAKKRAKEEAEKHHRKPQDTSMDSQQKMMQYYMLAMILVFGLMWPTAMSIYWAINSLVNIAKTLLVQKIINDRQAKEA